MHCVTERNKQMNTLIKIQFDEEGDCFIKNSAHSKDSRTENSDQFHN